MTIELDDTPESQNWLRGMPGPRPSPQNEFREAAKAVIAAYETSKKHAALDRLERTMGNEVYKALRKLLQKILTLAPLSEADPAPGPSLEDQIRYEKIWDLIKDDATFKDFDKHLNQTYSETNRAFVEGWENGKEPLIGQNPNLVGAFGSLHPQVIAATIQSRAAARVTNITDTIRTDIRNLLAQSRLEGSSYAELRRSLSGSFTFSRDRAQLIAVTELADAYEEGNSQPSKMLSNAGFQMQKSWLLVSDEKVCNLCLENQAAGWIPEDQEFPHGGDHPPAHPRCRCAADRRMDPDSNYSLPPLPDTTGGFREFGDNVEDMETWAYGPWKDPYGELGPEDPGFVLKLSTDPQQQVSVGHGGVYGDWGDSLAEDESMAVTWYAGDGYKAMNQYLSGDYSRLSDIRSTQGMVDSLSSALDKAFTPEDLITYRGGYSERLTAAEVGDTIDYYGFTSTTLHKAKAVDFATAHNQQGRETIYRMIVPQGANAAYLGRRFGIPEERELLFQKGSRWRVVKSEAIYARDTYGRERAVQELTLEMLKDQLQPLPDPSDDYIAQWEQEEPAVDWEDFAP